MKKIPKRYFLTTAFYITGTPGIKELRIKLRNGISYERFFDFFAEMESKLTDFVYFSLENRQIRMYSKSNKAFHASAQACANGKASFFEGDCGVKSYNKPTLSIKEQIDLFLARGLDIPDKKEPERFLSSVSYYRLRGYTYWMQLNALRLHSGRSLSSTYPSITDGGGSRDRNSFETVSFGLISKIFKNLKGSLEAKKAVCIFFGLRNNQFSILESWLQHLNVIRNICAHHGRLWDRVVTQVPKFTPQLSSPWIPSFYDPRNRYATVSLLVWLNRRLTDTNYFRDSIVTLFDEYNRIPLKLMGFPENWEKAELWHQ